MQDERRAFLGGIASLAGIGAGIGAGLAAPVRALAKTAAAAGTGARGVNVSTWGLGAPAHDAALAKGGRVGSTHRLCTVMVTFAGTRIL